MAQMKPHPWDHLGGFIAYQPPCQHQYCTDEAQRAETVMSAVRNYQSILPC